MRGRRVALKICMPIWLLLCCSLVEAQQDVRWLSLETWDACGTEPVDESSLHGRSCFAGLDLSTTTDLSALVLVFPDPSGAMTILPYFWLSRHDAACPLALSCHAGRRAQ